MAANLWKPVVGTSVIELTMETTIRSLFDTLGIRVSQEKKNEFINKTMEQVKKSIDFMKSSYEEAMNKNLEEEHAKYEALFKGNTFLEEMIARTVSDKLKVNVSAENTTVQVKLDWDGKEISKASDNLELDDYVRRPNPLDD